MQTDRKTRETYLPTSTTSSSHPFIHHPSIHHHPSLDQLTYLGYVCCRCCCCCCCCQSLLTTYPSIHICINSTYHTTHKHRVDRQIQSINRRPSTVHQPSTVPPPPPPPPFSHNSQLTGRAHLGPVNSHHWILVTLLVCSSPFPLPVGLLYVLVRMLGCGGRGLGAWGTWAEGGAGREEQGGKERKGKG